VQPLDSLDGELVPRANAVTYGLPGGVWTTDARRAHDAAHRMQAGPV
jgi:acyl-CoA reductase-like NAD-dependent aldehyde dehydrogenase